ncbi:unknown [Prevotella sp. CAG:5226]|nr:unknown [Prevotella sp. CAG:5226]
MMVIKFYMTDYNAFALTGRDCSNTGGTPGCRYACPGLWSPLGFQPALAKTLLPHRN